MKELGAQGKAASVVEDHVKELALAPIYDVVVADDLVALLLFRDDVASAGYTVSNHGEANAYEAVLDHVELSDLHIFVVDDLVVFGGVKIPRYEPKGNVSQKIGVIEGVLVEEAPLLSKDVSEEEFGSDLVLDRARYKLKCFIAVA